MKSLLRVSLLDSQVREGDWALLATPSIPRFSPITFWDTEATSLYLKHSSLNVITTPMQHQCSGNSCQFFLPPCPGWIISGLLSTSKHTAKSSILKRKRPSFDSSIFPSQHPTSSHYVPGQHTIHTCCSIHSALYSLFNSLQTGFCISCSHHHYHSPTPNPVPFLSCHLAHLPCIFFWPWAQVW